MPLYPKNCGPCITPPDVREVSSRILVCVDAESCGVRPYCATGPVPHIMAYGAYRTVKEAPVHGIGAAQQWPKPTPVRLRDRRSEPRAINLRHPGNRFRLNVFWLATRLAAMLVEPIFLREKAQRCSALARSCPDLATSHALEALAIEWMERAAELERNRSLILSPSPPAVD